MMKKQTESPSPQAGFTLNELAERTATRVEGDASVRVRQVATLQNAAASTIAFLANPRYRSLLTTTRASAVIVAPAEKDATALPRLISDNPYVTFARIAALLNPQQAVAGGVDTGAHVAADADVDSSARIAAGAVIGAGAAIGARTVVHPGVVIGERTRIGADCRIYPNVVVYHNCVIGDRAIIHGGAIIGADGFGMAEEAGVWLKIPQIGRVVIGNDVEIGANTTIDRGALDDTLLDDGVKLDNQIQIAHNCRIGAHTAIAGCVGLAGSVTIGQHCKVGGAAMISGHIEIGDYVVISGGTLVSKSIRAPGVYTAVFPLATHDQWLRTATHVRQIERLVERVRQLEKKIQERG
jgi:UDP-3-O-[3-hydroxymyristoyl] glucosamine N-acyltransferase